MKARILGLGIGVLLIVAAFGVVLWQGMNSSYTGVALAQGGVTATPTADATSVPSTAPSTAPQQQQVPQQQQTIGDTFWGILAGKLGVSADTLKQDALDARKEMLDQAVKDGRITQAQADALKNRLTSNGLIAPIPLPGAGQNVNPNGNNGPFHRGPFGWFGNGNGKGNQQNPNGNPQNPNGNGFGNRAPGMFPGFGFGMGRGMGANLQELDAVAKALKLDTKTLIQDLSQGQTLSAIAKAQNVDEATVKQAIIDYRKAQIDQLLSYGLISQVQADQMKANLTPDKIDLTRPFLMFRMMQNGTSSNGMFGGMGQMFGQMFGGFDQNGQPNQLQLPLGGTIQTQ